MPFAAAGAIAGVASAAVGVAGAIGQSGAAGAGAQQSKELAAQQRADLAPWRTTGGVANTASADLLGLNGQDAATAAMGNFQQSPGYQWSFNEGRRAVDATQAATGMFRSGATDKALLKFGTGLADQEFSNYYNRLFDMSKVGETAAAGGAYTAANAGDQAQKAGNTQASIYGDVAKGLQTGINQLGPASTGNYLTSSGYSNSPPAPINMNYTRSF